MRVDLLGLEAFLAIAEFNSFRRAARQLNLSQTAISHRLRKLELSLGAQLFTRTSRSVLITPAGAELLPRARELLDALGAHMDSVRDRKQNPDHRLTFACLPTVAVHLVPQALQTLRRRRPEAQVRVFDVSASEIDPLVASGEVEFGVTIMTSSNQDLSLQHLMTEKYLLVCPAGHPLARRRVVGWRDLMNQPLIRVSRQTANRLILDQALGSLGEGLNWQYEVQHTATAFGLVRQGLGLAVTPELAFEVLADHDLSAVKLVRPSVTRAIGILSRKSSPLSELAREFHDCLSTELTKDRRTAS